MSDKFISLEGITKRFPAPGGGMTTVFDDLWLSMSRGEFTCIIGHSGCGKTTVLNLLAGLDEPSAGTIIVDNQSIEGPNPAPRRDLPKPRAASLAQRQRQCRLCGDVEMAPMAAC